ncbi:hypothetical protein GOBAR_AA33261 [Gossypium barbadense]|uniref:Uncharacterized protein n=1 Tax=Gossypium barbadense TaxID=3634 RepID=A0A2P5W8L1_GOSBA|nr:hypothetical protein GOBAR_AA33261 [Gossypium barbadense]
MVREVGVAMRCEGADKFDVRLHQCDQIAENIAAGVDQGKDEIGGGYSSGGRGCVLQVLRQKNIITSGSYGCGRAGHGSRGGPFPVELQIPK